jgi:hypothetical protein
LSPLSFLYSFPPLQDQWTEEAAVSFRQALKAFGELKEVRAVAALTMEENLPPKPELAKTQSSRERGIALIEAARKRASAGGGGGAAGGGKEEDVVEEEIIDPANIDEALVRLEASQSTESLLTVLDNIHRLALITSNDVKKQFTQSARTVRESRGLFWSPEVAGGFRAVLEDANSRLKGGPEVRAVVVANEAGDIQCRISLNAAVATWDDFIAAVAVRFKLDGIEERVEIHRVEEGASRWGIWSLPAVPWGITDGALVITEMGRLRTGDKLVARVAAAVVVVPAGMWACGACSFHNAAAASTCGICGAAKPADDSGADDSGEPHTGEWRDVRAKRAGGRSITQWCNDIGDDDGACICMHRYKADGELGPPLQKSHWSCCGGVNQGEPHCGGSGGCDGGRHVGEFRTGNHPFQHHCKLDDGDSGRFICNHGDGVIPRPHWSCCGALVEGGGGGGAGGGGGGGGDRKEQDAAFAEAVGRQGVLTKGLVVRVTDDVAVARNTAEVSFHSTRRSKQVISIPLCNLNTPPLLLKVHLNSNACPNTHEHGQGPPYRARS